MDATVARTGGRDRLPPGRLGSAAGLDLGRLHLRLHRRLRGRLHRAVRPSPDGSLYYDDYELTEADCTNLEPDPAEADLPVDAPEEPDSAGNDLGFEAGCNAVFESEGVDELYWGEDAFTVDDCLANQGGGSGGGGAPPEQPDEPAAPEACPPAPSADGSIEIKIERGEVDCAGAAALWGEYARRAPSEGQGSGGFLEIEGWECIAAPAARAPQLGRCEKTDGSAAFAVSSSS